MYYSSIGILAILIHIIINYDVLFHSASKQKFQPHLSAYKSFLISVLFYYVTDVLWGIFYGGNHKMIIFSDTEVYFAAMAVGVFLWTRYVITYLNEKRVFSIMLKAAGIGFLIFEIIILIINLFFPILFYFDENATYHAGKARYITLILQIFLFMATSLRMIAMTLKISGNLRRRYRTIWVFGIAMTIFIFLQSLYPLLPFYAIGYLLGTCLVHTFILEDEKESRRIELEKLLKVEQIREKELGTARLMAYTDNLTGVKNKNAYLEDTRCLDKKIEDGALSDFAIVVFDVNNLKIINDTHGHDAGDKQIKSAGKIICNQFAHSPVYRIGGDEFVAFLFGEDFKNRESLLEDFNQKIKKNQANGEVVISFGMTEFNKSVDKNYLAIFERADMKMYEQKQKMKKNNR